MFRCFCDKTPRTSVLVSNSRDACSFRRCTCGRVDDGREAPPLSPPRTLTRTTARQALTVLVSIAAALVLLTNPAYGYCYAFSRSAATSSRSSVVWTGTSVDTSRQRHRPQVLCSPLRCAAAASPLSLRSSFFDDVLKFFDQFQQPGNENGSQSDSERSSRDNNNDDEEEDDEMPAGTTRIVTIPVQSIKPGGLRLFLMLYLLGQQNSPEPKSWTAHQPTTTSTASSSSPEQEEEYVLEYRYRDMSAALTVTLVVATSPTSAKGSRIAIDRTGSRPSISYLAQETAVVQGILDELQQMAIDESVNVPDRLLILSHPDSIQRAREGLAFL